MADKILYLMEKLYRIEKATAKNGDGPQLARIKKETQKQLDNIINSLLMEVNAV